MSETRHLIQQAIRELHIDIEPHNRTLDIKTTLAVEGGWQGKDNAEPGPIMVTGTNRKGDPLSLTIEAGTAYPQIVEALKTAWRG